MYFSCLCLYKYTNGRKNFHVSFFLNQERLWHFFYPDFKTWHDVPEKVLKLASQVPSSLYSFVCEQWMYCRFMEGLETNAFLWMLIFILPFSVITLIHNDLALIFYQIPQLIACSAGSQPWTCVTLFCCLFLTSSTTFHHLIFSALSPFHSASLQGLPMWRPSVLSN